MRQDSDVPGLIAIAVAFMAVFLVLVTMHIYAERFMPQPVLLEKRSGQSDSGVTEPTKSAGGSIRPT